MQPVLSNKEAMLFLNKLVHYNLSNLTRCEWGTAKAESNVPTVETPELTNILPLKDKSKVRGDF